jgi:glutathione-specific gamma-glutamylcyclotransferase
VSQAALHWVFAYGSLMWNPGFTHVACQPGVVHGYHRQLCVRSHHYRGTPEKPGVVFGLMPGGSCQGVAYGVEAAQWPETEHYLRERELITHVYREVSVKVRLRDSAEIMPALTYVVVPGHAQSMPGLSLEAIESLVREGVGLAGRNLDYVLKTWDRMQGLGLSDHRLEQLVKRLR